MAVAHGGARLSQRQHDLRSTLRHPVRRHHETLSALASAI